MNILALDDEELALAALKRELDKVFEHDDVFTCCNADEAMQVASRLAENGQALDYAFCDIQLPEISGLEVARMLKTYFPKLKIFFCTAYSQYAIDAFGIKAKGYLLKPITAKAIVDVLEEMVYDWKGEQMQSFRDIRVQTFGDFEVFVDGKPLLFKRAKAKELFAYLVDRKGAGVTTERIAAVLFENQVYDKTLKNEVTRTVSFLRADLKAVGVEDVLVKSWNYIAIDTAKIKCDAYDYERGDMIAVNAYNGEYMCGYEWAEFSTGLYESIRQDRLKNQK